jgi:hypothetical protein
MVFAHEFNLKCDFNIEHITKKKARKRDWFLREALSKEVGDHVEGSLFEGDDEYPLEYDRMKHFEPIGEEYQTYNEWEKIDREVSLIINSLLEVSVETEQAQAPEASDPAAQVEVSNPAKESMNERNITEEETKTAKDDHVNITEVATGEPTSNGCEMEEELSFNVGAAFDSQHVNKKAKPDFGFGGEHWGNRLGGMPNWSILNTYICSRKTLDGLQRRGLFAAYQQVMRTEEDTLGPHDVYKRVANLFNIRHVGLLCDNGYGYGGKISEKHVEQIFKKEGRLIVQGSLGGRVIPQPTTHVGLRPIPQPVPIQMGPTQPVVFKRWITSNAKPSMTGAEIGEMSQKVARQRMRELGLSTHGTVYELRHRLKKYYRI